jgi:hypothetical protein
MFYNDNIIDFKNKIVERVRFIYKSIILNYKSWIFLLVSLFLIDKNIISCFVSFILMLFVAHIAHYCNHDDSSYPFNVVHLYHHSHNNMFSHLIQILLEFNSLLFIIFLKYVIIFQYNINILSFVNDWTIVFFYIFYTTVHNINYSIFHVNHIHELHHKTEVYNIGPDIADIILGTKLNPETDLENTDHYILNITLSTIIVLILKVLFNKLPFLNHVFFITYLIGLTILIFYTIDLFIKDTDKHIEKELQQFCSK